MKIIAGKYKGRNINVGDIGGEFRPTKGIVREAVFGILEHGGIDGGLEGKVMMDVCCGSGCMGFEGISRGISKVIMIDNDVMHKENILLTMSQIGVEEEIHFLNYNVLNLPAGNSEVDVVYVDPPYGEKLGEVILDNLDNCGWLKSGAIVIIEGGTGDDNIKHCEKYKLIDERIIWQI